MSFNSTTPYLKPFLRGEDLSRTPRVSPPASKGSSCALGPRAPSPGKQHVRPHLLQVPCPPHFLGCLRGHSYPFTRHWIPVCALRCGPLTSLPLTGAKEPSSRAWPAQGHPSQTVPKGENMTGLTPQTHVLSPPQREAKRFFISSIIKGILVCLPQNNAELFKTQYSVVTQFVGQGREPTRWNDTPELYIKISVANCSPIILEKNTA